jgi:transcriptional regulator with XRE-family HTH domain
MTLIAKLIERFKSSFEYRHTYMESFMDSYTATQIKVLRERLELKQAGLADRAGMKQSQISALEDVNNSTWKVSTLRKLARAFDMVLVVRFEEFGSVLPDVDRFERQSVDRRPFTEDPIFGPPSQIQEGVTSARILTYAPKTQRSHVPVPHSVSTSSGHFLSDQAIAR